MRTIFSISIFCAVLALLPTSLLQGAVITTFNIDTAPVGTSSDSDFYIGEDAPNALVDSNELLVGNPGPPASPDHRAYMLFDLSGLLSAGPVTSATLQIWRFDGDAAAYQHGGVQVLQRTAAFTPGGASDYAELTGTNLGFPIGPSSGTGQYFDLTVTSAVESWRTNGLSNHFGFALHGSEGFGSTGKLLYSSTGTHVPQLVVTQDYFTRTWQNTGAPWSTAANWNGDVPNSGGNAGERAVLPSSASVVNPSLDADITISDLHINNDQADYNIVNSGAGARTLTINTGSDATEGIYQSGGDTSIGTAAGATTGVKLVPVGAQTWDITGTLTIYGTGGGTGRVVDGNTGEVTKTGSGTVLMDNGGAFGGFLKNLTIEQGTMTGTSANSSQMNLTDTTGDALTMYGGTELSLIRFAVSAFGDQSIRFNGSGSGTAVIDTAGFTFSGPANGSVTKTFNIDNGDAELDMEIKTPFGEFGQGNTPTTINIVKTGLGTLAIAGGSHDGTTSVEQGTLLVNGTHTVDDSKGDWTGTPTGSYTVAGGATLGGSGTINLSALNGDVTIQAGGNLSPGNTVDPTGTFTLFLGNGTLDISAIAGTGGLLFDLDTIGDSDKVVVGSTLDIGTLDFDDFTFNPLGGFGVGTYTLFQTDNIIGSLGSAGGTVGGLNALLVINGTNVQLNVVPEGSTLALAAAGLFGLAALLPLVRLRQK